MHLGERAHAMLGQGPSPSTFWWTASSSAPASTCTWRRKKELLMPVSGQVDAVFFCFVFPLPFLFVRSGSSLWVHKLVAGLLTYEAHFFQGSEQPTPVSIFVACVLFFETTFCFVLVRRWVQPSRSWCCSFCRSWLTQDETQSKLVPLTVVASCKSIQIQECLCPTP